MRSALYVLMFAVCLAMLDCAATANDADLTVREASSIQTEGVVTTTTTTGPKINSQTQLPTLQEDMQTPHVDLKATDELKGASAGRDTNTREEDSKEEKTEAPAAKEPVDTNEAAQVPQPPRKEENPSESEIKTDTITAAVQKFSDTDGTIIEGQSAQSQGVVTHQKYFPRTGGRLTEPKVKDAAALSTTTTTTAPALLIENNDSGTTQKTTSTVTSTMSQSTIQTTTLQKKSTIPNSVDKKDSCRSTSLLFAFTILITCNTIPIVLTL